jgi:hypothetical protein
MEILNETKKIKRDKTIGRNELSRKEKKRQKEKQEEEKLKK